MIKSLILLATFVWQAHAVKMPPITQDHDRLIHNETELWPWETLDHRGVIDKPVAKKCGDLHKFVFIDSNRTGACIEVCGGMNHDVLKRMSYFELPPDKSDELYCK